MEKKHFCNPPHTGTPEQRVTHIVFIYVCITTCQLSLLVTSVSLVSSCNTKWTYPPDNHVPTFDLFGDILAFLGQTDSHYFEP